MSIQARAFTRLGIRPHELWDYSPAEILDQFAEADRERERVQEERARELVLLTYGIARAVNEGKGLSMRDVMGDAWHVRQLAKDAEEKRRKAEADQGGDA